MTLIPRKFYLRISLALFPLLTVYATIQAGSLLYAGIRTFDEWEQRLSWNIAEIAAHDLRPMLEAQASKKAVKKALHRMVLLNPRLEPYIADSRGRILVWLGSKPAARLSPISTAVLEEFLSPKPSRAIPLYINDPAYPLETQKIFSAARISYRGKPAYLVLLLNSRRASNVFHGVKDFNIYLMTGLSTAGAILTVTLLGVVLFYFLTARFRRITRAVGRIAGGDYSVRVAEDGPDEIAELGRGINALTITVAQTLEKLRTADRQRRDMVANISHDLSTPVAAGLAYLENIKERQAELSLEERSAALDVAIANIKRLSSLIQDLFELSKLEARDFTPDSRPFPLADTVTEEILPRLKAFAAEHGVSIRAETADGLPWAVGDEAMIIRVINNLAENAIRYSGSGSAVVVRITAAGGRVSVQVSDNGAGIDEKDLPHVFDRFYRGDRGRRKGKGGTGLGLAIVQQIVAAHGSAIEAVSSPGKETIFSFDLPAAPDA